MINLAKPYGGVSNPHDYFVDGQINIATITSSGSKRILAGVRPGIVRAGHHCQRGLKVAPACGGANASAGIRTTLCSPITTWQSKSHTHQYDDKFDKTGVEC